MEIPNLISKFTSQSTDREYFFALEIGSFYVKSAIWIVINSKVQIVSTSNAIGWDGKDKDDLIASADNALSVSIQNLKIHEHDHPKRIVFGLPSTWVSTDKIKSEWQPFIKDLTHKLELKPLGFVVTTEAIGHFLKTTEGVPPSVILIGVSEMDLDVTLIKLGHLLGTQTVARSVEVASDLEEGLSRFSVQDMLPSRILLYDSTTDLEQIRQRLLDFPWQEKLPFLHFPKIEILAPEFSVNAVSIAAGTEFLEISDPSSVSSSQPQQEQPHPHIDSKESTLEEFGFSSTDSDSQSNYLPIHQDSGHEKAQPHISAKPKFQLRLPSFSLPKSSGVKLPRLPKVALTVALLAFISISLAASAWFIPKAEVSLAIQPKSLEKSFTVVASSSISAPDPLNKSIPIQLVSVDISDEDTAPATGEVTVGDKAKGEVTIYNDTPQTKNLPAGTTFTSPAGLVFVLDTASIVASKSGSAVSSEAGKATVKLTAAKIGSEYNLPSNTEFKVASFSSSDIAAKNASAFSGGSSRTVSAVSKSDVESLRSSLLSSIKSRAPEEIEAKIDPDMQLITQSLSLASSSAQFSHKAGEEAEEISLVLGATATAAVFSPSDLDAILKEELLASVPSGYQLSTDHSAPNFELVESDGEEYIFSVTYASNLLPTIDISQIQKEISGKSLEAANSKLQQLPGFVSAKTQVNPRFFPVLPFNSQKITFVLESSQQ